MTHDICLVEFWNQKFYISEFSEGWTHVYVIGSLSWFKTSYTGQSGGFGADQTAPRKCLPTSTRGGWSGDWSAPAVSWIGGGASRWCRRRAGCRCWSRRTADGRGAGAREHGGSRAGGPGISRSCKTNSVYNQSTESTASINTPNRCQSHSSWKLDRLIRPSIPGNKEYVLPS